MPALLKPVEMDTHTRRRRALVVQAALWAPTIGDKDTILEALLEQPDPPADRWPGPEAVTFSTEYHLSPIRGAQRQRQLLLVRQCM